MYLGVFPPWVHTIFEWLAIFIGMQFMSRLRQNDILPARHRTWIIAGCIFGAAIGSKLVVWLDHPAQFIQGLHHPLMLWFAGKGIGGAIVGGWLGVELTKCGLHIKQATGDLFVFPLITAIMIGRVGCFLSGYYDHTYGIATKLPWGVDFGDGIFRHPTQLYEILWLALMLLGLWRYSSKPYPVGNLFRLFMVGYFAFRLWVEWIKPVPHDWWGINGTQLLSIGVLIYYAFYSVRLRIRKMNQNGALQHDG